MSKICFCTQGDTGEGIFRTPLSFVATHPMTNSHVSEHGKHLCCPPTMLTWPQQQQATISPAHLQHNARLMGFNKVHICSYALKHARLKQAGAGGSPPICRHHACSMGFEKTSLHWHGLIRSPNSGPRIRRQNAHPPPPPPLPAADLQFLLCSLAHHEKEKAPAKKNGGKKNPQPPWSPAPPRTTSTQGSPPSCQAPRP